ncbi:MAG: hypothetical protein M1831_004068 [Alyxoria varia]|nr:MAG: hypothetical protein M1831_004068 [Alyxoria varia]
MGDPASLALGILPIAYSVGQGIFKYYDRRKELDQEVAGFLARVRGFENNLKSLEYVLEKILPGCESPVAWDVCRQIESFRQVLETLDVELNELNAFDTLPAGKKKLKSKLPRIMYPLNRERLLSHIADMEGLQKCVEGALNAFQLEFNYQKFEEQSSNSKRITDSQHQLLRACETTKENQDAIQNTMEAMAAQVALISQHCPALVDEGSGHQQQIIASTSSSLIQKPSLLQSACDQQRNLNLTLRATNNNSLRRSPRWLSCNCSRVRAAESFQYTLHGVSLLMLKEAAHERKCPFYTVSEKSTTLGARFTLCNSLLRYCVYAALSCTTGAGGFATSPKLELKRIVRPNSPAFKLFRRDQLDSRFNPPQPGVFNCIMQDLLQLYANGQASPSDVDEDERNVLTCALELFLYVSPQNWGQQWRTDYRRLINQLIALGVPVDYMGLKRVSGTLNALQLDLILDLSDAGGRFSLPSVFPEGIEPLHLSRVFTTTPNTHGDLILSDSVLPFNPLVRAILLHSQQAFRMALQHRDLLNDQDERGRTPLHWSAVVWPEAARELLLAGAEVNLEDAGGKLPLHYAICPGSSQSVEILLDAQSRIPLSDKGYNNMVECACLYYKQEVFEVLVRHLVRRRRDLWRIAKSQLPPPILKKLNVPEDTIVDGRRFEHVKSALVARSVFVNPHLLHETGCKTVYNTWALNLRATNTLFNAGFRVLELSGKADSIRHMLACIKQDSNRHDMWALAHWLASRGFDFESISMNGVSVKHELAFALADALNEYSKSLPSAATQRIRPYLDQFEQPLLSFIAALMASGSTCSCLCSCSKNCSSWVSFLRCWDETCCSYIYDTRPTSFLAEMGSGYPAVFDFLIDREEISNVHPEGRRQIAMATIRMATFQRLQLTHTCSCYSFDHHHGHYHPRCWGHSARNSKRNEDDINEIRDEEAGIIEQLETLMDEFEQAYDTDESLETFFHGYWFDRMEKFLGEEKPEVEVLNAARNLGVKLDMDD